ncbi:major facilitator superfamily domain-containing protein [Aspergillus californicus]
MANEKPKADDVQHIEAVVGYGTSEPAIAAPKRAADGTLLVPQPSDDPRDPLNWGTARKLLMLFIICLSSFSSSILAMANGSGLAPQATLYRTTQLKLSYSICAAVSGLAAGPFIWSPLAKCFGKSGITFWSLILGMVCNIWSAVLTSPDQYNNFVVSRFFACLLGSAATTVGSTMVVETFFLHDRGKALGAYVVSVLFGVAAGPTFSGFIVQSVEWPVQFWYAAGLCAFSALLCLLFLEETAWPRHGSTSSPVPELPSRYLARRVAVYLFTVRVTPKRTPAEGLGLFLLPFRILCTPAIVLLGIPLMAFFGWIVAISTLLPVFLQEPIEHGGFVSGYLVNDRLPLWICNRNGGQWRPEYRLYCLWVPVLFIYPPFLGLFGACLHYHLHYMVLAVSMFFISFSGMSCVSPCVNYAVEALGPELANETTVALNLYRLLFGIVIPFFIEPWMEVMGNGWTFGSMAVFTVVAFIPIVVLMAWGYRVRKLSFTAAETATEDGMVVA